MKEQRRTEETERRRRRRRLRSHRESIATPPLRIASVSESIIYFIKAIEVIDQHL